MPNMPEALPKFDVGDVIEHELVPGFPMTVLAVRECEADPGIGRPAGHLAYAVIDPDGNQDWLCAYDVRASDLVPD
jgi:hypothetical protein